MRQFLDVQIKSVNQSNLTVISLDYNVKANPLLRMNSSVFFIA